MSAATFIQELECQIRKQVLADLQSERTWTSNHEEGRTAPLEPNGLSSANAKASSKKFSEPQTIPATPFSTVDWLHVQQQVALGRERANDSSWQSRPKRGAYQSSPSGSSLGSSLGSTQPSPKSPLMAEPPEIEGSVRSQTQASPFELIALEYFRRAGAPLPETWTLKDLKRSFRQLALNLHPDRHMNEGTESQQAHQEMFRELLTCYQQLEEIVANHP